MEKVETLADFYDRYEHIFPSFQGTGRETANFNVNQREFCHKQAPYNRRDYYKISLIIGKGNLHFADKLISIDHNALVFFNPRVPYSWEATSKEQSGYFCLFTEDFINASLRATIQESPLMQVGVNPVFFINKKQQAVLAELYRKMLSERDSAYLYKYDLLRNYVSLVVHEGLKLQPAQPPRLSNASARIATLFCDLLERQFPVDSLAHSLKLRTANDYASQLSIHPNHLNRAVKETTAKTITEHISDRVVREAKALLAHTDWSVAEIAHALGFDEPSYFNNFFKKQTGVTPNSLRKQVV